VFKEDPEAGRKQKIPSMNDKCAGGTGAVIDKINAKLKIPADELGNQGYSGIKLHKVAGKCGVFAETDINGLQKEGTPSDELMASLFEAIVLQNLTVLTRGHTLRPHVLLLGGPNTFIRGMREAWQENIPKMWRERGVEIPPGETPETLIKTPANGVYFAALGAIEFGRTEDEEVGRYRGTRHLEHYITAGRAEQKAAVGAAGLSASPEELARFKEQYKPAPFTPATFAAGQAVRGFVGVDGGSTSTKAVLMSDEGEVLCKVYQLSKGNPIQDVKEILARIKDWADGQGARLEVIGFGATGYAADVLERTVRADANIVETVAHMTSATTYFGDIDVVCDIGGQDIKVLFLQNGDIKNFRLSNQCSAGNGMLLQAMADQFGVPITEYADTAFAASLSPRFSYGCAVFLDSDRVNFQKEGYAKEELLAGLAQVLPKNVWQYVVQIPRMAALGKRFVLQGGTQYNLAAVKAQVDYIKERVPGAEVLVHPHCGEAGAIGAAFEALRVVKRRGHSTFVGLDAAIAMEWEARNDESTRCHFCANNCARTFIDTRTPDGGQARYISGFSCEKGTVESKDAMVAIATERKAVMKRFPNLVDYEARMLFRHFYDPRPLPEAGEVIDDVAVERTLLGVRHVGGRRGFQRSDAAAEEHRRKVRIGIPRMLNIWSTAPFWRTYLETLGMPRGNVVFSDNTSEEMWLEGGKYGSVDPCFPAKVGQAHVHNLLFHHHTPEQPLHYIFNPSLTHVPSFVKNAQDYTSCPIVAGSPNVLKAAFTKEMNFFEQRGIRYLDSAFTLIEPVLLRRQLFETFRDVLRITEDESDFACGEAFEAMRRFDQDLEARGRAILDEVERDNRVALLLLGRPYHLDPGLNHGVLEEFQVMGFPILSIRSVPKDEDYLGRYFAEDLAAGRIKSPLEISDVWPENYSSNSAMKVWAAKFASRHPHVVILDLSSFKCGHDAPTYGIIDSIVGAAGTPYSALHDIDANKPGGSIKIRVKTYAHSLGLHQERLEDMARAKAELGYRIDSKRLELLRRKQHELAERQLGDTGIARQIAELVERVGRYERDTSAAAARAQALAANAAAAELGLVRLGVRHRDSDEISRI